MSNLTLSEFIFENYGVNINPPINKVTRFAAADKPRSKSCWIRNFGQMAVMSNWRTNEKPLVWRSEQTSNHISKMSQFDRKRYFAELNEQIARTEAETAIEKQAYITEYWSELSPITSQNPYFMRKKIQAQPDFKQDGTNTYAAPMYNWTGKVVGVQLYTDKFKWFCKGSAPKEAFYPIRNGVPLKECEYIFLAEGMATGLSLNIMLNMLKTIGRMSTWQTLVCFSAQNVPNIIAKLQSLKFKAKIIGCADNDAAGTTAMINIPHFVFDGSEGWDASDAYMDNAGNAVNELALKLKDVL